MKFKDYKFKALSEYQRLIDRFENVNDGYLLPDVRLVVRIDAHRFGEGWAGFNDRDYPYHNAILETLISVARRLMCLDLRVNFAFIHGDEISLLFDKIESSGLRRRAKFLTHIASAGAVFFQEEFKLPVFFRAKLSELPSDEHVVDYFFWQRKVALRNYFTRSFGTLLMDKGVTGKDISLRIGGLTEEGLWSMAVELGLKIEDIPACFLYGSGLWWNKLTPADVSEEQRSGNKSEYEILATDALPGDEKEYLRLLSEKISGESFLPEESGASVPWRMINLSQKSEMADDTESSDNKNAKRSSKILNQPSESTQFRIGRRKGAKVISQSGK